MSLRDLLIKNKHAILEKWFDIALGVYAEQGQTFFKKQKDRFANPVGHTTSEGIESIYDELLKETESDKLPLFLENIMRIRAVQDFSASDALSFIPGLKRIIREQLGSMLLQKEIAEEWAAFESKVDRLALLGFDAYTNSRQRLFDSRVNEVRTRAARLLKMAGIGYDIPVEEKGVKNGKADNA